MEMRVLNTAVFLLCVDCQVRYHALCDKLLADKLTRQGDIFLHRQLVLQGNVEAVSKLGILSPLRFFHGVPERGPVLVLGGGVIRENDFRENYSALLCVVAKLSVVVAVQFLPGPISCAGNR